MTSASLLPSRAGEDRHGTATPLSRAPFWPPATWVTLPVGLSAFGIGLVAGGRTESFLLLAAIAVVGGVCLVGARCRLVICVVGALVLFQSELATLKYAYLAIVFLCFLLSLRSVLSEDGAVRFELRPLVAGAIAFTVYLLSTYVVARGGGISFDFWFRDVLSYFLLVMLPFVGIAAGSEISERWNRWWIVLVGVACSVGLTADWLERRGVSALPFGRFLLSSTVVVGLCFAYAVTMAGLTRTTKFVRMIWGVVAAVIVIAMILSGSRTNLVLLVAFAGVVGYTKNVRVTPLRAGALISTLVLALVVVTPLASRLVIADPAFLQGRIDDALRFVSGQADNDQSFEARRLSYEWVARSFAEHPVLGTGPGYLYQLPDIPTIKTFTLDAPGITPAKFGVVGTVVVVLYLYALASSVVRSRRIHGQFPFYTAARGWLVVLVVLIPFGPWLEDKGLGVALAILFAGVIGESRGRFAVVARMPVHAGTSPVGSRSCPSVRS